MTICRVQRCRQPVALGFAVLKGLRSYGLVSAWEAIVRHRILLPSRYDIVIRRRETRRRYVWGELGVGV
jgi:hypothetical protein